MEAAIFFAVLSALFNQKSKGISYICFLIATGAAAFSVINLLL